MFGLNPKLALGLGVLILLVASNAVVGYKAFQMGQDNIQVKWDADKVERAKAQAEAENTAANEIDKTKKGAQIVYKYIREMPDNAVSCPVSFGTIERLPEPSGSQ